MEGNTLYRLQLKARLLQGGWVWFQFNVVIVMDLVVHPVPVRHTQLVTSSTHTANTSVLLCGVHVLSPPPLPLPPPSPPPPCITAALPGRVGDCQAGHGPSTNHTRPQVISSRQTHFNSSEGIHELLSGSLITPPPSGMSCDFRSLSWALPPY